MSQKSYKPDHLHMTGHEVLSQMLNRSCWTRSNAPRPLVCLDLDGTLLDNNRRTLRILEAYAQMRSWTLPSDIDHRTFGYGPLDVFEQVILRNRLDLPAAIESTKFKEFWFDRFFTDDWQQHDEVAPGSPAFVQALISGGCDIVYLTGRDREKMMLGVVKALRDNGFPVMTPETRIVLKPEFNMKDLDFKLAAIAELRRRAEIIGLIDNEPSICNVVHELLIGKDRHISVLFDSTHTPDPPELHTDVAVMKSFEVIPPGC